MKELEQALRRALRDFRVRVEPAGDDIVVLPEKSSGPQAEPLFTVKNDGLGREMMYKIVRPSRVANCLSAEDCVDTIQGVLKMDYPHLLR